MNEHLRDRILRKVDSLSDERGYQILDYVEFLESRYAERPTPGTTSFTRFAEAVEDRLRAGKVSATTIAEAMNLMNRAANVLNGALAAGRSLTNDIVTASRASGGPQGSATHSSAAPSGPDGSAPPSGAAPTNVGAAPEASSPAHDTKMPGSGEEKL
jgi:hypothetical protein